MRLGFSPIASLSYEVLDQHCPVIWKQMRMGREAALTGWDPALDAAFAGQSRRHGLAPSVSRRRSSASW